MTRGLCSLYPQAFGVLSYAEAAAETKKALLVEDGETFLSGIEASFDQFQTSAATVKSILVPRN